MRETTELLRLLRGGESGIYLAEVLGTEPLYIVINGVRIAANKKAAGAVFSEGDEVLAVKAGDEMAVILKVVNA